jgi:hypothetical protein
MKIIAFTQLHNEYEKGNLINWFKSVEFCDYIFIYDQNSTKVNKDYYKKFNNTFVIESKTNNFKNELFCKATLLKELLNQHPDVDWIFWMDGDTILNKFATRENIESILMTCQEKAPNIDALSLGHKNLWRSDTEYRIDNEYDWFDKNGRPAFWKNNGKLYFPEQSGLHMRQYPNGLTNIVRIKNPFLIHRGFATDEQIIERYKYYKSQGQNGWELERLIDEETLALRTLVKEHLPDWYDVHDRKNEKTIKQLISHE